MFLTISEIYLSLFWTLVISYYGKYTVVCRRTERYSCWEPEAKVKCTGDEMRSSQIVAFQSHDGCCVHDWEWTVACERRLTSIRQAYRVLADEESYNDAPPLYFFWFFAPEITFVCVTVGTGFLFQFLSGSFFFFPAAAHLSAYLHKLWVRRELGYANARTMKLIADWLHCGDLLTSGRSKENAWEPIRVAGRCTGICVERFSCIIAYRV